ncbi:MAG: preprotein translocase subunit SecE [Chloroflexota bacterium]
MFSRPNSNILSLKKPRFQTVKGVFAELKKVSWPSRQEAIRLSLIVIAVCVAVGIVLGLFDLGFTELVKVVLGAG